VKLTNSRLAFSPSDLNGFLSCPHLTSLSVAVARDEIKRPFRVNAHAELIRRKGDEHEDRYLAELADAGREITTIDFDDRDWDRAARETEQAIHNEADVIYQAALREGDWRGLADFVIRTPNGYEVYDTKLARHAKPQHVLQLAFYTEQVARIQGHAPAAMHIVTGLGETETFRPEDFAAYYRRLRQRFLDAVEQRRPTYPYPVDFCSLCDFLSLCKTRWDEDDHLTLVAGMSRLNVERLGVAGITTLAGLARAEPGLKVKSMRRSTFDGIRHQAELQLHYRETGEYRVDDLPVEDERGYSLMPEPSPGDIWLDFEGDPWFDPRHGLEYLTGWIELDEHGEPGYHAIWAHDRPSEKAAFERFVDHVVERRRRFPGLHVYHYAAYERTALTRLMGEHATREEEIDDLLRGEVLVDLFRVTKQALRASVSSYSIKDVEKLYGFERTADVSGGSESVNDFERWLEIGEQSLLDGIRDYNEEDCVSLLELHRWLFGRRPGDLAWRLPPDQRPVSEESEERQREHDRVRAELLAGAEEGDPNWLLAQLIDYHRGEARPQWWAFFHHLGLDEEELLDSGETLGGLELVSELRDKQSFEYMFEFPSQEHKISGPCVDPATERGYSATVDNERGRLTLRRGVRLVDEPLPRALIPPTPLPTWVQRDAVLRFAKARADYPALVEILERRPPSARLDGSLADAALSLDGSYLFVQGPPGSGKTWNGARMAIELMRAGRRVGITALSHKAIHKFLEDVEAAAAEQGFVFHGLKKCSGDETRYEGSGLVENTTDNAAMLDPEVQLLAGTSFLFSREELDRHVDTLFIDEGGQFALADAFAVGTAARNLVLLGDPNQLPQVSQGSHPEGADSSVLGHLLGTEHETVRPGMGLFLEQTWRMRPEVNAFISEAFYESRLEPAPVTSERDVGDGRGIRFLPVAHTGHRLASPEEAEAVAGEIARLLGTPYRDGAGERALGPRDFIVVAPYNAHVRCLREKIPDPAIRIGTVDKFQGQEATVVFFSMASSSGEDVSRGLEFLFSRNRLNVAVSRARCLAYVVASPRLLEASCKTVDQMRLANSLCRFVELASPA
jgi:predicted RecB family nuclease